MAQRKPNPKCNLGPDYVLLLAKGLFYLKMSTGPGALLACGTVDIEKAKRMKGPGLASAERALKRRGYVVERVRVDE